MRKIKFRAWDKEKKDWLPNFLISQDGLLRELKSQQKDTSVLDWQHVVGDRIKLMQYTELKDKNGKEIYEGDVVQQIDDIEAERTMGEKTFEYEVVWLMGDGFNGYYIQTGKNPIHSVSLEAVKNLEIIGNIYENKELIK